MAMFRSNNRGRGRCCGISSEATPGTVRRATRRVRSRAVPMKPWILARGLHVVNIPETEMSKVNVVQICEHICLLSIHIFPTYYLFLQYFQSFNAGRCSLKQNSWPLCCCIFVPIMSVFKHVFYYLCLCGTPGISVELLGQPSVIYIDHLFWVSSLIVSNIRIFIATSSNTGRRYSTLRHAGDGF